MKGVAENAGEFYQHYPRAATIVTVNSNGRKNAMAVAWHCPVSFKPALYGIAVAPKRYTYRMISESRQFAINFMPYEKAESIAEVGGSREVSPINLRSSIWPKTGPPRRMCLY